MVFSSRNSSDGSSGPWARATGSDAVLADRQDLTIDPPQIAQRRHDLLALFTEADHQAGLGRDAGALARALEELEGAAVASTDRAIR